MPIRSECAIPLLGYSRVLILFLLRVITPVLNFIQVFIIRLGLSFVNPTLLIPLFSVIRFQVIVKYFFILALLVPKQLILSIIIINFLLLVIFIFRLTLLVFFSFLLRVLSPVIFIFQLTLSHFFLIIL